MYQEIAVAKGPEYDRLNQKMDRCQENIETLSDEIQRCQGKCVVRGVLFVVIFCLAKQRIVRRSCSCIMFISSL